MVLPCHCGSRPEKPGPTSFPGRPPSPRGIRGRPTAQPVCQFLAGRRPTFIGEHTGRRLVAHPAVPGVRRRGPRRRPRGVRLLAGNAVVAKTPSPGGLRIRQAALHGLPALRRPARPRGQVPGRVPGGADVDPVRPSAGRVCLFASRPGLWPAYQGGQGRGAATQGRGGDPARRRAALPRRPVGRTAPGPAATGTNPSAVAVRRGRAPSSAATCWCRPSRSATRASGCSATSSTTASARRPRRFPGGAAPR